MNDQLNGPWGKDYTNFFFTKASHLYGGRYCAGLYHSF